MKKVIIITGLTGSGKSKLAIELAKKYDGEIISADSVQIYRGLNIGSAKENELVMKEISHHLINIKEANESYNVGEFVQDCKNSIENILSRGKLPIIVGGTGLYVKALLEGFSLGETQANEEFRIQYQELAKKEGNIAVWNILNELNPIKAKTVHPNNLKRVIRYLEIENFGSFKNKAKSILSDYSYKAIGIVLDREIIYEKINKRVDEMIYLGLEQEVKGLIKTGINRDHQSVTSIGYREWFDYFDGKIDKQTTIDLIKQHTRNYCKRQLTFLKTLDIELANFEKSKEILEDFLNDRN